MGGRRTQRHPQNWPACQLTYCSVGGTHRQNNWSLGNWHATLPTIQDLTRLPSQTTSSRWQVDKEAIGLTRVQQLSHVCVARPYQIYVNFILKHIHILKLIHSFGSLFRLFITLCEKEYFFISNLHCSII